MEHAVDSRLAVSETPLDWNAIHAAVERELAGVPFVSAEESDRRFKDAIRRGAEEGDRIRREAQST